MPQRVTLCWGDSRTSTISYEELSGWKVKNLLCKEVLAALSPAAPMLEVSRNLAQAGIDLRKDVPSGTTPARRDWRH